jgi:hypothetical protein
MIQRASLLTAMLIACGLVPAGCSESSSAPPPAPAASSASDATPVSTTDSSPPEAAANTVGPRLVFASRVLEFGAISDTKLVTRSFTYTNTGDETLRIDKVSATCRCTVPDPRRKVLNPGESGELDVEFDPRGKWGDTTQSITILSNAILEPALRLTVHAIVEPMLRYDRNHKLGIVKLGEGSRSLVQLSYDDPDLTIRDITTNNPLLEARLIRMGEPGPVVDGVQTYEGTMEITLSPKAPWGSIYASRVEFMVHGRPSLDEEPVDLPHRLYVTGDVYGELQASPNALAFGRLAPDQAYEYAVRIIRPSNEPFAVTGARVNQSDLPGIQTRVEPVSPSEYRIVLYGTVGSFRGGFRGIVVVNTDVPGEEEVGVRFAGLVR